MNTLKLYSIGTIHQLDTCQEIKLLDEYKPALLHIDKFSHVILLWLNNDPKQLLKKIKQNNKLIHYFNTTTVNSLSPIEMSISKIKQVDDEKALLKLKTL